MEKVMNINHLEKFLNEIKEEKEVNEKKINEFREYLFKIFNEENRAISHEDIANKVNKVFIENDKLNMSLNALKHKNILLSNIFLSVADKFNLLSQFNCPICGNYKTEESIIQLFFQIELVSLNNTKKTQAFKKAIKENFKNKQFNISKDKTYCVVIIYGLGTNNEEKDLDNMTKPLLDAFTDILYQDDVAINHLNTMKIKLPTKEDCISFKVRESKLNEHIDVLFNIWNHKWLTEPIKLNNYV